MATPLLYRLYVLATGMALPFVAKSTMKKLRLAGVSDQRTREKLGFATTQRLGQGPLIWFHGASVGESLSVLSLIETMGKQLPDAHFLMTSGTATSAELVGKRLPPRTQHQFAPLDAAGPVKRFLKHWRPDAAIFVESELWPQMLRRTFATGARMALVNARLSEKSVEGWKKRPALARFIVGVFDLILTQNSAMADTMREMGAEPNKVDKGFNLKSLSMPLPVDKTSLHEAKNTLNGRPVWIASSTHEGEEETVLAAHKAVLKQNPDTCLILAPRHPERADKVAQLIEDANLSFTRRSTGGQPEKQVYLADTLGELGTWYTLSDIVFLGGSLKPIGGHNPFEVAQAGAALISGAHVANFAEDYANMANANAVLHADDAQGLSTHVINLLNNPVDLQNLQTASTEFANSSKSALVNIANKLIDKLELS